MKRDQDRDRASAAQNFGENFPPRAGRVHEVTGPAAFSFAVITCGMNQRNALWISESRHNEQLNPVGLASFLDPDNLLLATGKGHKELLALSEEALRSGAVSTVVVELKKPLSLTAGRRLQLAAEAGGCTGIVILPEEMGSNAAETRWRCVPVFDEQDSTFQSWQLIKNKLGTLKSWKVRWDAQARCIIVVSETGERADPARPDGDTGL